MSDIEPKKYQAYDDLRAWARSEPSPGSHGKVRVLDAAEALAICEDVERLDETARRALGLVTLLESQLETLENVAMGTAFMLGMERAEYEAAASAVAHRELFPMLDAARSRGAAETLRHIVQVINMGESRNSIRKQCLRGAEEIEMKLADLRFDRELAEKEGG